MMGAASGSLTELVAALADAGLRGALLLGVVAAGALALRRAPAAGRHLVWLTGVAGLLLLPLASMVAPRWSVPGADAPWWSGLEAGPAAAQPAMAPAVVAPRAPRAMASHAPSSHAATAPSPPSSHAETPPTPGSGMAPSASAPPTPASRSAMAPSASARPSPASRSAMAPPALPLAAVVLGVWVLGVLLLLSSLGASLLAVRRLAASARPFPPGRVTETTALLAKELGVASPVRVLEGEPGTMPVSWGVTRPVILVPEGAERWHAERLTSVLLHELAHVRRRDCLTQLVAEVARALHWPNPLAWLALERLRVEREMACDDLVVERGARPSTYAGELLSLARGFDADRRIALAALAMARPTHLRRRVAALLDEGRRRRLSRRGAVAVASTAALVTVALAGLAPAAEARGAGGMEEAALDAGARAAGFARSGGPDLGRTAPPAAAARSGRPGSDAGGLGMDAQAASCGTASTGWKSMSSQSRDGDRRLTWERPGCEVDVRIEGEVAFTDDFRDVARLGRGARFVLEEVEGGSRRRLELRPGADGRPDRQYRVDGRDAAFDAAARAWYEALLLQVFRRGGLLAEERVASLLRGGGVQGVLAELDHLDSDHVFALYVGELLGQASLDEGQVVGLVGRARERVESDHYMSQILDVVAARYLASPRVLDAFLRASTTVESDHYRAGVLTTALQAGDPSREQVVALLEAASSMESDHYLAGVLEAVGERFALDPGMRGVYLRAVGSIESDHYRAGVLATLLRRRDMDEDELAQALRAAGSMGSDHYVGQVLDGVAELALDSEALRGAYLEVASGLGSDHYRSRALEALLERDDLSREVLVGVLEAARGLGSDHEKARLLTAVASRYPLDGGVRDAFLATLDTVGSDHYRGQVANLLLKRERGGG